MEMACRDNSEIAVLWFPTVAIMFRLDVIVSCEVNVVDRGSLLRAREFTEPLSPHFYLSKNPDSDSNGKLKIRNLR